MDAQEYRGTRVPARHKVPKKLFTIQAPFSNQEMNSLVRKIQFDLHFWLIALEFLVQEGFMLTPSNYPNKNFSRQTCKLL